MPNVVLVPQKAHVVFLKPLCYFDGSPPGIPGTSCGGSSGRGSRSKAPGVWKTPADTERGSGSFHKRDWWNPQTDWNAGKVRRSEQEPPALRCSRMASVLPVDVRPQGGRLGLDLLQKTQRFYGFLMWVPIAFSSSVCADLGNPLLFTVAEECPEEAAVEVIQHRDEEQLVELKGRWELRPQKKHAITNPWTHITGYRNRHVRGKH